MLSLRGPEMEERGDRLPPIRQDPVRSETYITKKQLQRQMTKTKTRGDRQQAGSHSSRSGETSHLPIPKYIALIIHRNASHVAMVFIHDR